MKKTIKRTVSMLCAATLIFSMAACAPKEENSAATFVSLDINPAVELTVDGKNKVVSVYGENEDGKILLYDNGGIVSGIVGEDVETAVAKITDLAVEYGFLSENNKVVSTSVSGNDAEKLQKKIDAKITATAGSLGLTVTTDAEGAYSLVRAFEKFKAEHLDDKEIQAMTIADFRLAVSASETGEVTLEAAVTMDKDALIAIVSKAHEKADAFATEAFTEAKRVANAAYEKAETMAVAGIYSAYALKNFDILNITYQPYCYAYAGYEMTACGLEAMAVAVGAMEKVANYELTEEQVQAVLKAFALEDTTENRALLADDNGKITVVSVEAYADVLFKNTPAGQELDKMKAALNTALDTAESKVEEQIKLAVDAHKEEIEAAMAVGDAVVENLSEFATAVPADLKTALEDYHAVCDKLRKDVADKNLTAEGLRVAADELHAKAETISVTLDGKLTEEQRKELNDLKETALQSMAAAKVQMNEAIEKAEQEARKYLQDKKDALLDKIGE